MKITEALAPLGLQQLREFVTIFGPTEEITLTSINQLKTTAPDQAERIQHLCLSILDESDFDTAFDAAEPEISFPRAFRFALVVKPSSFFLMKPSSPSHSYLTVTEKTASLFVTLLWDYHTKIKSQNRLRVDQLSAFSLVLMSGRTVSMPVLQRIQRCCRFVVKPQEFDPFYARCAPRRRGTIDREHLPSLRFTFERLTGLRKERAGVGGITPSRRSTINSIRARVSPPPSHRFYFWKDVENFLLLQNFETLALDKLLALFPYRTRESIYMQARTLRLSRDREVRALPSRWSKKDEAKLLDEYGQTQTKVLAKELKRTPSALRHRAQLLVQRKRNEYLDGTRDEMLLEEEVKKRNVKEG